MSKPKAAAQTPATLWLRQRNIPYTGHTYDYTDHGGARHAAETLGLDLHAVAKTLLMEDENAQPLIVLMHGDQTVSTKNLARQIGRKKVTPCDPAVAERHSGYQVGGTSPFGTRKTMPVWVEAGLLDLPTVYVNGGRRGLLIAIAPQALITPLGGRVVRTAISRS